MNTKSDLRIRDSLFILDVDIEATQLLGNKHNKGYYKYESKNRGEEIAIGQE